MISLSAEQNIYMLWKKLKEDDFETDIIEVLRSYSVEAESMLKGLTQSDFSEIFLFFDCDANQNNLKAEDLPWDQVLLQMLETFSNETEHGKLYISYPMAEALRDADAGSCKPSTKCLWRRGELKQYKNDSGQNAQFQDHKKYDKSTWMELMNIYWWRVGCLFGKSENFSFEEYRDEVDPKKIFEKQIRLLNDDCVFVLSCFPEFLLDYFKKEFWDRNIKLDMRYAPAEECERASIANRYNSI